MPSMRTCLTPFYFALVAIGGVSAAPITFGPVKAQPGESIRLVASSNAISGTITRWIGAKPKTGQIDISRDRELHWTFREPEADGTRRGLVKAVRLSSSETLKFGDQEEKSEHVSTLTGKLFTMTKPPTGEWEFKLDGGTLGVDGHKDIDELKSYLKREWFPDHPVKTGDSWEFDPAWIKSVIERDLGDALTIGTMTLSEVRKSATRSTATIGITIRSNGEGFQADGALSEASVDLKGKMVVNLETMLDESLELEGTVTKTTRETKDTTKVSLPVRIVVTKDLFKAGGNP